MRLRHDLHTLTGVYALDAIDDAERERFERHLNRCPSCEHEVRGLQETATRLAVAAAQAPPPGLKSAVLTQAAHTRQHPPVVDVRPQPQRSWRPRRLAVTVAALGTAVIIALGVAVGVQQSRLDQARTQQQAMAAVLSAPDARMVRDHTSLGGTATVVASRRLHELVFTARGLPSLSDSRVYELWLIGSAGATRAGLLPRAVAGRTATLLASGLARGDRVGVTVEPAGGTNQPTTKPIVVIPVTA